MDISARLWPHTLQVRRWLAAWVVFTSPAVQALGRDVPVDEFLPAQHAQVTWVTTCGEWTDRTRTGFYRIVHAERHAQSFLYLQWLTRDENGNHTVVATAAPNEIDNDHAEISLENLRCQARPDGVLVRAKAYFGHENLDGSVEVRALARPGAYRFTRRTLRGKDSR